MKVEAVQHIPAPTNKGDLRKLLGNLTYMSNYVPQFSHSTKPLQKFLNKDAAWEWTTEQQVALDKIREYLSTSPTLQIFDTVKPTTVTTDASGFELGTVLLQRGKPVAYASRSLAPAGKINSRSNNDFWALCGLWNGSGLTRLVVRFGF